MKMITTRAEKYIESITSVITLANGAVPRITVGTDYALLRDEESQLNESRRALLKRPNETPSTGSICTSAPLE